MLSCRAASILAWPAIRPPSSPTSAGVVQPHAGDPIPPAAQEQLFQPFSRGSDQPGQRGLGLGLYIASEIAKVHGGTLTVASSPDETRFTFRMPLT